MSNELTTPAPNPFERIKRVTDQGADFWSARELARVLAYSDFRNFISVINKARQACENSGRAAADHFVDTTEMVGIGSGAWRPIEDWSLSRYACYLVIQNADPGKPLVALGQTYFAVQTRRQELADNELRHEDQKRLFLHAEISQHQKRLADAAKQAGVVRPADYAVFMEHGYRGLYGGLGSQEIQQKRQLDARENLLNHMGSTELAANLFRATQTEEKLRRDNVRTKQAANEVHKAVGQKVRQTMRELGGTMPEELPPAEDIRNIGSRRKRRLRDANRSEDSGTATNQG